MENLHILIPFVLFLILLILLDGSMILSLLKQGDERRQLMVWKASTFTLLVLTLTFICDIVRSILHAEPMTINPFVKLSTTAIMYTISLLYFKKQYGD
ncbi:hypothetical protein H9X85_10215 [Anaerotignum lactatifermentans]|uniref:Histidine kinase n=1 Tax=Anaerotignum lactatifermentans TaxID=160404 RepID=A0ABS2GCA0_9FIRM|nr:hypothetical protein [Anaerotignum lactatifermentans]MBM6829915.1 hypothetical protein [Anaerotignum lactatifermentans]MBM6878418.1 hypothetical protein [Anaerotignum lactatifermentans]MBM6951572.1 hypothetical protein [Anaerotignum lactatifermentans]